MSILVSVQQTASALLPHIDEMLVGRETGPLHLRLIMQPLMAIFLAVRVGLRDAREGRPPYFFWPVFVDKLHRKELISTAWKDIGKVFIAALVLEAVYEIIVYRWLYPTQAVVVAVVLAIIPYLLVRGPVTRLAYRYMKAKGK